MFAKSSFSGAFLVFYVCEQVLIARTGLWVAFPFLFLYQLITSGGGGVLFSGLVNKKH